MVLRLWGHIAPYFSLLLASLIIFALHWLPSALPVDVIRWIYYKGLHVRKVLPKLKYEKNDWWLYSSTGRTTTEEAENSL